MEESNKKPIKENKTVHLSEQSPPEKKMSRVVEKKEKPFGLGEETVSADILYLPSTHEITVSDTLNFIKQARKFHQKIEKQLDEIYKTAKLSPQESHAFLNNPSNFSPEQWEQINSYRKELIGSLETNLNQLKLTGSDKIKEIKPKAIKKSATTSEEKTKIRKKKMLGARRNWISMD